jgi:hypothetical protein
MKQIVVILFILLVVNSTAHAYTHDQMIKAIIGEAEGESQRGKDAVACAIINRGSLKGVYGLHAYRVTHHLYSKKTVRAAELADERAVSDTSYCSDLIGGATGWGSASDVVKFRHEAWFPSVYFTAHIGNHYFYGTDG